MKTPIALIVLVAVVAAASEQEDQYRTIPSPRIIGGNEAIPNSFPYQAFLTSRAIISSVDTTWTCSGSIITKNYILTSADCVYKPFSSSQTTTIILGAHNVSSIEGTQVFRGAAEIIVEPTYPNRPSIQNNIALVKMDREIEYNFAVQPVRLPTGSEVLDQENFIGHTARVSGWGLRNGTVMTSSNVLYYIDALVMKSSECKHYYMDRGIDTTILCTSGSGKVSICQGDVGAPLVADFKQIGISSFWYPWCTTDGSPSGYTRVTSYMNWIVDNSDYVWPFWPF